MTIDRRVSQRDYGWYVDSAIKDDKLYISCFSKVGRNGPNIFIIPLIKSIPQLVKQRFHCLLLLKKYFLTFCNNNPLVLFDGR